MAGSSDTRRAVVCLVTSPPERAREIAAAVVEGRLAACVNIVALVESIYWWEGAVERDEESLLVIKTTRGAVESMTETIRAVHPYETFELVAIEVETGHPAYLDWIAAAVGSPPAPS